MFSCSSLFLAAARAAWISSSSFCNDAAGASLDLEVDKPIDSRKLVVILVSGVIGVDADAVFGVNFLSSFGVFIRLAVLVVGAQFGS